MVGPFAIQKKIFETIFRYKKGANLTDGLNYLKHCLHDF